MRILGAICTAILMGGFGWHVAGLSFRLYEHWDRRSPLPSQLILLIALVLNITFVGGTIKMAVSYLEGK